MPIGLLLFVGICTVVLLVLVQQGYMPRPFNWIVIGIVVVVWLVLLLQGAGLNLGTRVG
jgi:hypothetical protein